MPSIDDVAKAEVRSVFTLNKWVDKKMDFKIRLGWSKAPNIAHPTSFNDTFVFLFLFI